MVSVCSPREFDQHVSTLICEQSVADQWQRADATKQLVTVLRRHDYLSVVKVEPSLKNDPMFELWAEYPVARREPDWVQRDLLNAWNQVTVNASQTRVAFRKTNEGFEALFLALFRGSFVTGRMAVAGVQIDRNLAMGKKADRIF